MKSSFHWYPVSGNWYPEYLLNQNKNIWIGHRTTYVVRGEAQNDNFDKTS